MASELTYTGIDEAARRKFERAWMEDASPLLENFLPAESEQLYLSTLVELVQIELELAWKASGSFPQRHGSFASQDSPRGPLVESYLSRFPVLCKPTIVRSLVLQEFRVRRLHGDSPPPAEYFRRFPELLLAERDFDTLFALSGQKTPGLGAAADAPSEMPCAAGYEVIREIGRGGMGFVYEARQPGLDRLVALKTSRQKKGEDGMFHRFLTEARIAARLEHPGVVPVHQLVSPPGEEPFYTMKLVRGRRLDEAISQYHAPNLPPTEKALLRRRLLEAYLTVVRTMAFAHSRSVIHRDLKPANVILGEFGETIILDWGLAKILQDEEASFGGANVRKEDLDVTNTAVGAIIGTPAYMAPEQTLGRGDLVDICTDVYALGAMLYEILTSRPPHRGETVTDLLHRIETMTPTPPRSIDRGVPRPLQAICLHALAKRREDRYQQCNELAEDVERFLAGEPVSAYQERPMERLARWSWRRRTLVTSLLVGGVLTLVGIVVGINLLGRAERVRLQQASEYQEREVRQQTKERINLAQTASAENEQLAKVEVQAGDFLEGARILQRAMDRLKGEPELATQRASLETKRERALSLATFYARWEEAQRIAADSPEVLTNRSDDEMLATCEQALTQLQALKGVGPWWDRLPTDELTKVQRKRLEEGSAQATGKRCIHCPGNDGPVESKEILFFHEHRGLRRS